MLSAAVSGSARSQSKHFARKKIKEKGPRLSKAFPRKFFRESLPRKFSEKVFRESFPRKFFRESFPRKFSEKAFPRKFSEKVFRESLSEKVFRESFSEKDIAAFRYSLLFRRAADRVGACARGTENRYGRAFWRRISRRAHRRCGRTEKKAEKKGRSHKMTENGQNRPKKRDAAFQNAEIGTKMRGRSREIAWFLLFFCRGRAFAAVYFCGGI